MARAPASTYVHLDCACYTAHAKAIGLGPKWEFNWIDIQSNVVEAKCIRQLQRSACLPHMLT